MTNLPSALIELADETRVRGAVEHYYALVADAAAEFVDPIPRLQTLCGAPTSRATAREPSG